MEGFECVGGLEIRGIRLSKREHRWVLCRELTWLWEQKHSLMLVIIFMSWPLVCDTWLHSYGVWHSHKTLDVHNDMCFLDSHPDYDAKGGDLGLTPWSQNDILYRFDLISLTIWKLYHNGRAYHFSSSIYHALAQLPHSTRLHTKHNDNHESC